jgi:hypothetical protein
MKKENNLVDEMRNKTSVDEKGKKCCVSNEPNEERVGERGRYLIHFMIMIF